VDEQFERDRICYEHHSESFRNLNTQMWQVPIIAMTLTGGLWFGIVSSDLLNTHACAAKLLLTFCGICDILFIMVLCRVRLVMTCLIEKLVLFNEGYAINPQESDKAGILTKIDKLVVILFSLMLGGAAVLSFLAALYI
jgi:hypothetical protein